MARTVYAFFESSIYPTNIYWAYYDDVLAQLTGYEDWAGSKRDKILAFTGAYIIVDVEHNKHKHT